MEIIKLNVSIVPFFIGTKQVGQNDKNLNLFRLKTDLIYFQLLIKKPFKL